MEPKPFCGLDLVLPLHSAAGRVQLSHALWRFTAPSLAALRLDMEM